jgi:hypothetical protein
MLVVLQGPYQESSSLEVLLVSEIRLLIRVRYQRKLCSPMPLGFQARDVGKSSIPKTDGTLISPIK